MINWMIWWMVMIPPSNGGKFERCKKSKCRNVCWRTDRTRKVLLVPVNPFGSLLGYFVVVCGGGRARK